MLGMKLLAAIAALASGVAAHDDGACTGAATVTVTVNECGPAVTGPAVLPPPPISKVEPTGSDSLLPHPIEPTGVPPIDTPGESYGTAFVVLPTPSLINNNSSVPGNNTHPSTTLDQNPSQTTSLPLTVTDNGATVPTVFAGLGSFAAAGVLINAALAI